MKIEYDPEKNRWNIKERNLSFELAVDLDWGTSQTHEDRRKEYPEIRYITQAYLDTRLHIICFTPIEGGIRVISFRKANRREQAHYERKATH